MKLLKQYSGLRRELYILFWGRVVTNMGALIWPMMTLILTRKLGYSPGEASDLIMLIGVLMLPGTMIGGKLADRFDKKKLICICDSITVLGYIICALIPLSSTVVLILAVASFFAQLEWPSYDSMVANLSSPMQRERAYSLNYLGGNLGLVLAPTLGGLLFESHLDIAFWVSGLATLSSTVLIFFFVKDTGRSRDESAGEAYEDEKNISTARVLFSSPVLLLFIFLMGIVSAVHAVSMNFMMPLSMDSFFGERGALLFGTLSSVNGLTVIIGTPLLTAAMTRMRDTAKLQLGAFLETAGCTVFALSGGSMLLCYMSMIIFTSGSILLSLGEQPYISRRIPASHRGRMSAVRTVGHMFLQAIFLYAAGHLADSYSLSAIWAGMIAAGIINVLLMYIFRRSDRRQFGLLYGKE